MSYESLLSDLQKMWARTRPGQLAPLVAPQQTGYDKLLTKAIDAKIDGHVTLKQLAAFRIRLSRAMLAEQRKAAPRPLAKALPRPKRVLVLKPPAPVISERDAQLIRLKVAHLRAGA